MSNVVFILGAGASKQAGAPLMGNFLDVASDLFRSNLVNDKKEHFERVFSVIGGLQAVHSKAQLDLNNIESIFTALELGKVIQRVPGIEYSEIPTAIASLKELIVKTLETTIEFPTYKTDIRVPEPYEKFTSLIWHLREQAFPNQSVAVISFNYDIALDFALYKANLGPNYVIEKAPQQNDGVDLLKLHGSLNWATEKNSKRIKPLHLSDYMNHHRATGLEDRGKVNLPIGSHLLEYFTMRAPMKFDVEPEPVIVPPSWNKAEYHHALSDIWACAANHLAEAESIFIIGYSLPETDSFFRHLYALGSVGKSTLRRIFVYNPDDSGETDRRFKELLGPGSIARYKYIPKTFDNSLRDIQQLFPSRR